MKCWAGVVLVGMIVAACGEAGVGAGVDSRAAGATESGQTAVTPPGGLVEWLSDIEAGLPSVADVSDNRGATQRGLFELYVGRQELIEQYWGPSGRLQSESGAELAKGVLDLESAFHELLQAIMTQPPDTIRVASAIGAVRAQVSEVRVRAVDSGLILIPPDTGSTARG